MTGTGRPNQNDVTRDSLQPRVVWLEKDLEQLVKRFLHRKESEMERLRAALSSADFDTIRGIGHDLKGAGEGFGFPELSILGAKFELAAKARDSRSRTIPSAARSSPVRKYSRGCARRRVRRTQPAPRPRRMRVG